MRLTKEQAKSLKEIWLRSTNVRANFGFRYLQFRRTVFPYGGGVAMVPWCGMIVGIEPDGYAHT